MTYDVQWTPLAKDMLTEVWMAADRNAVTAAAHRLDHALARSPLSTGVALDSSVHRRAEVPPITIEFYVVEDDKRVVVQGVAAV